MKMVTVLLLAVALGVTFASVSFAECAGHSKTATVTPPDAPAPSTSRT
jgi:hypothetical protein